MSLDEAGVPLERLLGVLHGLVPLLLVEEAEGAVGVVVRHRRVLQDRLGVAVHRRVVLPKGEVLVAQVLQLLSRVHKSSLADLWSRFGKFNHNSEAKLAKFDGIWPAHQFCRVVHLIRYVVGLTMSLAVQPSAMLC